MPLAFRLQDNEDPLTNARHWYAMHTDDDISHVRAPYHPRIPSRREGQLSGGAERAQHGLAGETSAPCMHRDGLQRGLLLPPTDGG